MKEILSIALELSSGFILLFLLTKLVGKTQFSQITPFDFISALILGELVGNAVYDDEIKLGKIVFAVVFWGLLVYIVEMITQKFKSTRKLLEGEPNILIHKGELKYDAMKKINLDINRLQALIRQQGYFSFQEVEYAIMESNGMVSVMPKAEYDKPKNIDLNVVAKPAQLPIGLILDGSIVQDKLAEAGVDEKWLHDQLTMQGVTDVKEVLYAEFKSNQPLYVVRYEKQSS